jgi:hypothetical protein
MTQFPVPANHTQVFGSTTGVKTVKNLVIAFGVLVFVTSAPAQGGDLTGSWRGSYMGIAINLVVSPDQRFSEQEISTVTTMQQGQIVPAGPGLLSFVVETWAPRTMPVYHPVGTSGGYWTEQPTTKPPGGTYRVTFNSANSMTMQDVSMGGSITFQRVQ